MNEVEEFVKERWEQLTAFSNKNDVKEKLWQDIVYRYCEPHRAYHNLNHIAYIFSLLSSYLPQVKNPAVMGFAILYHDIVYDTYRKDNEKESAEMAAIHLTELMVKKEIIEQVKVFIMATKLHEVPTEHSLSNDLALFLDLDMAILGEDFETYKMYSSRIRKEYAQYSDELYRAGRKEALEKFLSSENIFITEEFRIVIEDAARKNIRREIGQL